MAHVQIKLWNWEKNWACEHVYEGHSHYVMMVRFNPKDPNYFASASLDRTIRVWGITTPTPHYTLEGHAMGVNCVDYYPGGDRPYLISGADDKTVKVWDFQTKTCVQTLPGHTANVSQTIFHPRLPLIITGSEDGTVRIWHSVTFRLESTLNYAMDRCWAAACTSRSNALALGFDEGLVVLKLGKESPVASMDRSGRVVWARNNDIQTASVRGMVAEMTDVAAGAAAAGGAVMVDGESLPVAVKDMGTCDVFPQSLQHNANGRFLAVCGDGEFIIYTGQALRNKSFGSALDFVWSSVGNNDYAVRESTSSVKVFRNFKEAQTLRPGFAVEAIFGGALLALCGHEFVCFYLWDTCQLVRRIEAKPKVGAHVLLLPCCHPRAHRPRAPAAPLRRRCTGATRARCSPWSAATRATPSASIARPRCRRWPRPARRRRVTAWRRRSRCWRSWRFA